MWYCIHVTMVDYLNVSASKEAAFAHAVASAGVVHSVSRGCRDGQLASCGCSGAKRPKDLKSAWIWGGCGDNIEYGYKWVQALVFDSYFHQTICSWTKLYPFSFIFLNTFPISDLLKILSISARENPMKFPEHRTELATSWTFTTTRLVAG